MIEEFSGQFVKVRNYCLEHSLIEDSTLVILALSGGIDSIYLLYFLIWLKQRKIIDFEIKAAHLNHQIRMEADQDQAFVENICANNNIDIFTKKMNIPDLAKQRQHGVEEAGRFARHQFFSELVDEFKNNKIYQNYKIKVALGHHQDDLAESVLMNIGRGTGLAGLSTLKIEENFYIRPLLNTSKEEILDLVKQQEWKWVEDETNASDMYLRNRIRHQLLPLWNEITGYDIRPIVARLSQNLNEDEAALNWSAQKFFEACLINNKQLSLKKTRELPRSLFKEVIDLWLECNNIDIILNHAQSDQLWQITQGRHGNKLLDVGNGVRIKKIKQRLILTD